MREFAHIKHAVPDADEIVAERDAATNALKSVTEHERWRVSALRFHKGNGELDGERMMAALESRGYTVKRMTDRGRT